MQKRNCIISRNFKTIEKNLIEIYNKYEIKISEFYAPTPFFLLFTMTIFF